MRTCSRRVPVPRRGAAAIELGLTLPMILILFSGMVDLGFLLTERSRVLYMAHESLRWGVAVRPGDSPIDATLIELEQLLVTNGESLGEGGCTADLQVQELDVEDLRALSLTLICPYLAPVGLIPMPAEITVTELMLIEDQGFSP